VYGGMLTIQTVGFFEFARSSDWLTGDDKTCVSGDCKYIGATTYLQISIMIEFIIFSCRAPGFIFSPKYLWGDGRPSWPLFTACMLANILVTVLAGVGVVIHQVRWVDLAYIWIFDIAGLIVIDLIKVILRTSNLPWMSAGASYGVLEYPDLPVEVENAPAVGSLRSGIMSMNQSRVNARSVMRSSQVSVLGGAHGHSVSGQRSWEPKSSSMLPFPYNLRANAERNFNFRSF